MKLRIKAYYAVMAMVDFAHHSQSHPPISLGEIANRQELPLPYLGQIFNKLKKIGMVRSARGSNGGCCLNDSAQDICILDIIQTVDKPLKMTRCDAFLRKRSHTHDLWEELGAVVHVFLAKISLEGMCQHHVLETGRFGFYLAR